MDKNTKFYSNVDDFIAVAKHLQPTDLFLKINDNSYDHSALYCKFSVKGLIYELGTFLKYNQYSTSRETIREPQPAKKFLKITIKKAIPGEVKTTRSLIGHADIESAINEFYSKIEPIIKTNEHDGANLYTGSIYKSEQGMLYYFQPNYLNIEDTNSIAPQIETYNMWVEKLEQLNVKNVELRYVKTKYNLIVDLPWQNDNYLLSVSLSEEKRTQDMFSLEGIAAKHNLTLVDKQPELKNAFSYAKTLGIGGFDLGFDYNEF